MWTSAVITVLIQRSHWNVRCFIVIINMSIRKNLTYWDYRAGSQNYIFILQLSTKNARKTRNPFKRWQTSEDSDPDGYLKQRSFFLDGENCSLSFPSSPKTRPFFKVAPIWILTVFLLNAAKESQRILLMFEIWKPEKIQWSRCKTMKQRTYENNLEKHKRSENIDRPLIVQFASFESD